MELPSVELCRTEMVEIECPEGADPALVRLALSWGLHPDEALPRAQTWLHERRNWQAEVGALRAHIAALEASSLKGAVATALSTAVVLEGQETR